MFVSNRPPKGSLMSAKKGDSRTSTLRSGSTLKSGSTRSRPSSEKSSRAGSPDRVNFVGISG